MNYSAASVARLGAVTAAAVAASACATVTRGDKQTWTVTSAPPGAAVQTSNGFSCAATPCAFKVKREADFAVTVRKAGYTTWQGHVGHQVAGAGAAGFAGNALVGGVIGAGVDVATGATLELTPNPLAVTLRPAANSWERATGGEPSTLGVVAATTDIAAADPPAAPATAPPPAYDFVRRPGARDIERRWPTPAMERGEGGRAEISCGLAANGALRNCRIDNEDPANEGFGEAALALAPLFRLRPGSLAAGALVHIPIVWPNADGTVPGAAPEVLLANPVWLAAPSFADMAAAYPAGGAERTGVVHLRCGFDASGAVTRCTPLDEAPAAAGFAAAALSLAHRFQLQPDRRWTASGQAVVTNITIRFEAPSDPRFTGRMIAEPRWVFALDPATAQALFPAQASAAGARSGVGRAICTVAADGSLTGCAPGPATPEGLGFSQAAVAAARAMRMNPWTDDGGPVDGARVTVPLQFDAQR